MAEAKRGAATSLEDDIVDAPRDAAARARQEAAWAGTRVDVRQQLHAREAALVFAGRVRESIRYYHIGWLILGASAAGAARKGANASPFARLSLDLLVEIAAFWFGGNQRRLLRAIEARRTTLIPPPAGPEAPFRLFIRPRPLLPFEHRAGEYACVEVSRGSRAVLTHKGMLSRTGKRLNISHLEHVFDHVFNSTDTQREVCARAVGPLVNHVLGSDGDRGGGHATLLLFGQTGTGKTYTLSGALEYVVRHMLGGHANAACNVTFFEIHGKKAYDLLQDRKVVRLLSDEHDVVHVRGARRETVTTGAELRSTLDRGLALRSIEVTERNPVSSRSHAICKLEMSGGGTLTLVDLAGSERNYETHKMTDRKVLRESAEINKALGALKNCFRAYHAISRGQTRIDARQENVMSRHGDGSQTYRRISTNRKLRVTTTVAKAPYRHSMLTRVLKRCFEGAHSGSHRTCIVATVSPTTTDLEHTLNSLKHVSLMAAPALSYAKQSSIIANDITQAEAKQAEKQQRGAGDDCSGGGSAAKTTASAPLRRWRGNSKNRGSGAAPWRKCGSTSKLPSTAAEDGRENTTKRKMLACVTADLALSEAEAAASYHGKLVHLWSADEVQRWVQTVDGGRFSSIVLPPNVTGETLMQLGSQSLTELFEGITEDREARAAHEGSAWTVGFDDDGGMAGGGSTRAERRERIGRALWRAIRKEQQAAISGQLGLIA